MPPRLDSFRDDLALVPDEVLVYRRVAWDRIGGRENCAIGKTANLNANCFSDYPEDRAQEMGYPGRCMSVGVGTVLKENGFGPEKMLEDFPDQGLAVILASDLRKLERPNGDPCPQGLMLAPTSEEPWHGIVFDRTIGFKNKPTQKAILRISRWAVPLVRTSA